MTDQEIVAELADLLGMDIRPTEHAEPGAYVALAPLSIPGTPDPPPMLQLHSSDLLQALELARSGWRPEVRIPEWSERKLEPLKVELEPEPRKPRDVWLYLLLAGLTVPSV